MSVHINTPVDVTFGISEFKVVFGDGSSVPLTQMDLVRREKEHKAVINNHTYHLDGTPVYAGLTKSIIGIVKNAAECYIELPTDTPTTTFGFSPVSQEQPDTPDVVNNISVRANALLFALGFILGGMFVMLSVIMSDSTVVKPKASQTSGEAVWQLPKGLDDSDVKSLARTAPTRNQKWHINDAEIKDDIELGPPKPFTNWDGKEWMIRTSLPEAEQAVRREKYATLRETEITAQIVLKWNELGIKATDKYICPDRSRPDILTEDRAWEVEWVDKWEEAIGQSAGYAKHTDRGRGIILIFRGEDAETDIINYLRCKVAIGDYDRIKLLVIRDPNNLIDLPIP